MCSGTYCLINTLTVRFIDMYIIEQVWMMDQAGQTVNSTIFRRQRVDE
jgi:hypothetical protein